jgi:hypothetical protein
MKSTRRELIEVLTEISELAPDFRFGQLVTNFSYAARGQTDSATWDVEDDELLEAAKEYLEVKRQSTAGVIE